MSFRRSCLSINVVSITCKLHLMRASFSPADVDNNGFISKDELTELFRAANLPLPGYRVREIIQELTVSSEQLTLPQFTQVRESTHPVLQ